MSQVVKPTGNKHNLGLDMWSGPYPTHYLGKRPGNENDWGCPSCPNFVLWVGCPVAVSKQNSFEISFSGHLSGAPANNFAGACLSQETGSKLLTDLLRYVLTRSGISHKLWFTYALLSSWQGKALGTRLLTGAGISYKLWFTSVRVIFNAQIYE